MKQIKKLAQYYVDLLVKLGIVRFSIILALALVALAVVVQIGVTLLLKDYIEDIDIIRSVFFGLLVTPWAVYFLSVVVDQLELSRQRLSHMVNKLGQMRERDQLLNSELQNNIQQLNQQIEEREKAEKQRQIAITDLKNEMVEREKTQVILAEQTALMRSFLDASPDLIYYRNRGGKFLGCNKAMETLLGKTQDELIGLTAQDVYEPNIAKQVIATDRKVFEENQEQTYELWLQYPNGKKACFEFRKLPFYRNDGKHLGLVGYGRDITERKASQDSLEKLSRDKTTFISTISHELRTPLNGIVGLSRMLLDSKLDQEQRKYMQTINVSAVTLGHIFNDIIDMDKFDRNRLELLSSTTDLHSFIADLESISGLMAEQKGLSFDLACLTELPAAIFVDATRLRQVLWNLISNAMKFTKQGGVMVNVSADYDDDFAELVFEIEDTGIGIPDDQLDKIFAMYYQVKSGKDNLHAVGTGIGLAVSQELIHRMNGEINVVSDEGFGSTFTVTIRVPLAQLADTEQVVTPSATSLRIFMVEDIELNVTVARSLLEKLGHSVDVAMTGEEALQAFQPESYDLVLLDIQLPDMTGFDIVEQFRAQYSHLPPVVALTANVLKDKQEYVRRGMDDVINKPISVTEIQRVLQHCIDGEQLFMLDKESHASEVDFSNLELQLLDIKMLQSYSEIVGIQPVLDSIELFEQTMPDYLDILDSNMLSRDQQGIVEEAHKIKGAAGSIGLARIQQAAQKAQSPDLPSWWENISSWIDEIKQNYQYDLQVLKQWLLQSQNKSS